MLNLRISSLKIYFCKLSAQNTLWPLTQKIPPIDTPSGVHPLRELKAQRKTVTLAFLFAAFKHTRERILEIVLCKVLLIRWMSKYRKYKAIVEIKWNFFTLSPLFSSPIQTEDEENKNPCFTLH